MRGDPTVAVSISMPASLVVVARKRAEELHMNFSEYIRFLIRRDVFEEPLSPSQPQPSQTAPSTSQLENVKRALQQYSNEELKEMYQSNDSAIVREAIVRILLERANSETVYAI